MDDRQHPQRNHRTPGTAGTPSPVQNREAVLLSENRRFSHGSAPASVPSPRPAAGLPLPSGSMKRRLRPGEGLIHAALLFCASFSIFTTVAIVLILGRESFRFFAGGEVSLLEFFTATKWQPVIGELKGDV